ncbi:MAG: PQQ-binding-like beta-propeller repeat protein, partial [Bacillota bacterium]
MNYRIDHCLVTAFVGICCLLGNPSYGADWPQMRGPGRGEVSPETGLAREWPAGGPKVLWTIEVGVGFAGAAVRDGEVYLLDRVEDRQDVLRCLDLNTGKELWSVAYEAVGTLPYNGSRNVPTVDEKYVFAVGPFGHVNCVDRKTHGVVWSAHLVNDFKDPAVDREEPAKNRAEKLMRAQVPEWGVTQSPLLYEDLVIVGPQTQKVGLVAYEKATGKVRWKSGYIGRNWYSHVSPTLVKLGGVDQVIMLAQPSDPEKAPKDAPPAIVSAVDPRTGEILWSV